MFEKVQSLIIDKFRVFIVSNPKIYSRFIYACVSVYLTLLALVLYSGEPSYVIQFVYLSLYIFVLGLIKLNPALRKKYPFICMIIEVYCLINITDLSYLFIKLITPHILHVIDHIFSMRRNNTGKDSGNNRGGEHGPGGSGGGGNKPPKNPDEGFNGNNDGHDEDNKSRKKRKTSDLLNLLNDRDIPRDPHGGYVNREGVYIPGDIGDNTVSIRRRDGETVHEAREQVDRFDFPRPAHRPSRNRNERGGIVGDNGARDQDATPYTDEEGYGAQNPNVSHMPRDQRKAFVAPEGDRIPVYVKPVRVTSTEEQRAKNRNRNKHYRERQNKKNSQKDPEGNP